MLILFVSFHMEISTPQAEPVAGVMRLIDIQEEIPPPPPPILPPEILQLTDEAIAEIMIETDEPPPPVPARNYVVAEQIQFLRLHEISVRPVLPEDEIVARMVYPPIAQRSNIEGVVMLELFIDRHGNVRDVRILREDPPNRGFGEAALNAFRGIRGSPAQANGEPVAVRFRYDLRFTLR